MSVLSQEYFLRRVISRLHFFKQHIKMKLRWNASLSIASSCFQRFIPQWLEAIVEVTFYRKNQELSNGSFVIHFRRSVMTATQSHQSQLDACIEACLDCLRECETCATACLDSDMVQMMAQCIKTCRDCADTCDICARFMARNSDLHAQLCGICAEACDRCAAECAKHDHDHCKQCAESCRRCAESCRQMAAAMS